MPEAGETSPIPRKPAHPAQSVCRSHPILRKLPELPLTETGEEFIVNSENAYPAESAQSSARAWFTHATGTLGSSS
jgi:hypothetical protein